MSDESAPDLRVLVRLLAKACADRWPGVVKPEDAARLDGQEDPLLVGARVACAVAVRAGLPKELVARIVEEATRPQEVEGRPKTYQFDNADVVASDVPACYELMWAIDRRLADPSTRGNFPGWFVDRWYPDFLRRVASGTRASARDRALLGKALELAKGRRG